MSYNIADKMGLNSVRSLLIDALRSGQIQHERRTALAERTLLATDEVSAEFVIRLLTRCSGRDDQSRPHHFDRTVECHVFTPKLDNERWYVKAYFLSANAVFISVHRSGDASLS